MLVVYSVMLSVKELLVRCQVERFNSMWWAGTPASFPKLLLIKYIMCDNSPRILLDVDIEGYIHARL